MQSKVIFFQFQMFEGLSQTLYTYIQCLDIMKSNWWSWLLLKNLKQKCCKCQTSKWGSMMYEHKHGQMLCPTSFPKNYLPPGNPDQDFYLLDLKNGLSNSKRPVSASTLKMHLTVDYDKNQRFYFSLTYHKVSTTYQQIHLSCILTPLKECGMQIVKLWIVIV